MNSGSSPPLHRGRSGYSGAGRQYNRGTSSSASPFTYSLHDIFYNTPQFMAKLFGEHNLAQFFILKGPIPSKKNSRIKPKNCKFTIASAEYRQWQANARASISDIWRQEPLTSPIRLMLATNCRNDLDNLITSVLDALETIIYDNDRRVLAVDARKIKLTDKPKTGERYITIIGVEQLNDAGG